jgi:hypothetical protein
VGVRRAVLNGAEVLEWGSGDAYVSRQQDTGAQSWPKITRLRGVLGRIKQKAAF